MLAEMSTEKCGETLHVAHIPLRIQTFITWIHLTIRSINVADELLQPKACKISHPRASEYSLGFVYRISAVPVTLAR